MTLRDAILMVSIYSTELCLLFLLDAAISVFFTCKDAIISMVTFDFSVMLFSHRFKSMFGIDCFFTTCRDMGGKMKTSAGMINEQGAGMISCRTWATFVYWNKTGRKTFYLIARDTITWLQMI